ncbi:MAG: ATP-binding protein, partial [SAR324 cluster bacterium]|nr:ATP-binding protein [SAR324 cluster bacterium]
MKRDIYHNLLSWKNSDRRKPLVLRGARQVGKTYIIKKFGQAEYERTAYFDFEESPDLAHIFSGTLDPKKIIRDLSRLQGWQIEPVVHLIVFDEIQASNAALNALKYFQQNANEFNIISAGSLLGVKLSKGKSFPVGKVNFLDLYPLTFLEFLDAINKPLLREMIEETEEIIPYALPLHNELIDLLKEYYVTGGMPEVVNHFAETGNLIEVREIQKEIIDSFVLDFSKHANPSDIQKISLIWDSIPSQLAKENRKFIFSAIKRSARGREYENAIGWLSDAGLILKSYAVSSAKCPLKGYMNSNSFKVFMLDIGILGAMAKIPIELVARGNTLFDEYRGAFVENYVAQQLVSHSGTTDLAYWKSEGNKAELDFLVEYQNEIFPLEAKAGINPKSKSLHSYKQQFDPQILSRTTLLNLKKDGRILNYPLYAVSLFPQLGID